MNGEETADEAASFQSSKLGTKEYWDTFYTKELENFGENKKDEGEIWFGHSRMMKVVNYLLNEKSLQKNSSILDIGCGNGAFLLEMADEGYTELHGIDYSHTAVKLAENIASEHGKKVTYRQADFLNLSTLPAEVNKGRSFFDVCHDKGTYDAISLRPDDSERARQLYITNLKEIMNKEGLFIITSCNWTLAEIQSHFSSELSFLCHIPAPTFQYGGKSGATVATAIFRNI